MSVRRAKPVLAVAGVLVLAIVLSGCVAIKPGSYSLSQPAGIGPVTMKFTLCTLNEKPAEESATCGPIPAGEGAQAQVMVGLLVPPGASTPDSFSATPAPGSPPLTFTRNAEVAAQMSANVTNLTGEVFTVGVPAGFELAGYISGTINEVAGQAMEWAVEPRVVLPAAADGGSSGAPFTAILVSGWRNVEAGLPASRPVECDTSGETPNNTSCGAILSESEATLGVSDLKVDPPAATATAPGRKVKLPFALDFASSAAQPPKFALAAGTTLPGAGLCSPTRASERCRQTRPPTGRRRPRARRSSRCWRVPRSAATKSAHRHPTQGGAVSGSTVLRVEPKGKPKVKAPGEGDGQARLPARHPRHPLRADRRDPLPAAAEGSATERQGPDEVAQAGGQAKRLGSSKLRLRLPRRRVEALLAIGKPLRLQARVRVPGKQKPQRLGRTLKLR